MTCTAVPVVWLDAHPLCWDQAIVDDLLAGVHWPIGYTVRHYIDRLPGGHDGGILVVPARYKIAEEINDLIAGWRWALVILTSDEEPVFKSWELDHPNMRVWVQSPHPKLHAGHDRVFGVGYTGETRRLLAELPHEHAVDWFFSGQVNHQRRRECLAALRWVGGGEAIRTPGFTQGLGQVDYLTHLADAKVIPCPSGPHTADSFRLWEALEAGCVPLADAHPPGKDAGYWDFYTAPFPVVDDWIDAPAVIGACVALWPTQANRCGAWWQHEKWAMAGQLSDDIYFLSGEARSNRDITVLIPVSPIPSHPDTAMVELTVESVRRNLPDAEIILMCDGVRPEQEHRRQQYEEHIARLLHLCRHQWRWVLPIIHDEHVHQANMTYDALDYVDTPYVVFVEHDTPFSDEPIDWPAVLAAMGTDQFDVIRFYHEAQPPGEHGHLMIGDRFELAGCPLQRTIQWSQRPHIALTDYYRRIISTYFPPTSRTMIEDKMHGVAQDDERGNRLAIYAPEGTWRRSLHLDGRGADPKFEMVYE